MSAMTSRISRPPFGSQRGVTLIEVLISVVVLALGVLSLVALQLVSKRNNADAEARSLAAHASSEILERMRMNRSDAALTAYVANAAAGIGRDQQGGEPNPSCVVGEDCTDTQLADHDIWLFEQLLDGLAEQVGGADTGGLINPTACITGPGTPGVYTVAVVWRSSIPLVDSDATITACGNAQPALYGTDAECEVAFGKTSDGGTNDQDCFRRIHVIQALI